MPERSGRWAPLVVAGAMAVAAVVIAVLLLTGGDNDGSTVSRPPPTQKAPATAKPRVAPRPSTPRRPSSTERAEGIQQTVSTLVGASERGDARATCRLLGQSAAGSGLAALDRCARRAHVDLTVLPSSDELSIERVKASGKRGTARLAGHLTISLRRAGRRWRVTGVRR
jgi:hypothetical protein